MKTNLNQCFVSNAKLCLSFMRLANNAKNTDRARLIGKVESFLIPIKFAATDASLSGSERSCASRIAARIDRLTMRRYGKVFGGVA